ncbi:unnamed protein product [Camellia sinensis]
MNSCESEHGSVVYDQLDQEVHIGRDVDCEGGTVAEDYDTPIPLASYMDANESKDVTIGNRHYASTAVLGEAAQPLKSPLVVFINSPSSGRHGLELKGRLQDLMGRRTA